MSSLPDLEAWAIFAKLAETGSFVRAADDLHLSKAAISKAVARLESRLGTALLVRTTRQIALTEIGRRTAERAAKILADAEEMDAEAMAHSTAPTGLVRITAPMTFGVAYLAPMLPHLMNAYPELSIDLHLTDEVLDLIRGSFDLALRIAALPDSTLRVRQLCQVRRLLVGSPDYFTRHARPAHPLDLSKHTCLGYTYLATSDRWQFAHNGGESVTVVPKHQLRINNAEALVPALLAGLGLALQPEFLIWRELAAGELEVVMSDWSAPLIALNIVTPPGQFRPARINSVIEFLASRLAAAPWAVPSESGSSR
jgi:DNA-binding transcriptional LysR family regulator